MKVTLKGFPTEFTEQIDMPDIGELLMMPPFFGIEAEDFRKHATEFQKYLLDKAPIRNDKKHVTVRSQVSLLEPRTTSHTGRAVENSWHIDGTDLYQHIEPKERVHILSSACKSLTVFNVNPVTIDVEENENMYSLCGRICSNPESFGIIGKEIEPCRIYTFDNHLHHAPNISRIEFRYFIRFLEYDDDTTFSKSPVDQVYITDHQGNRRISMDYGTDRVSIFFPKEYMRFDF